MISLKYLAAKVLGISMQQSALGHDSIEDSTTALNVSLLQQEPWSLTYASL